MPAGRKKICGCRFHAEWQSDPNSRVVNIETERKFSTEIISQMRENNELGRGKYLCDQCYQHVENSSAMSSSKKKEIRPPRQSRGNVGFDKEWQINM